MKGKHCLPTMSLIAVIMRSTTPLWTANPPNPATVPANAKVCKLDAPAIICLSTKGREIKPRSFRRPKVKVQLVPYTAY